MPFFDNVGLNINQLSLRTIGGISPAIVNSLYPMKYLTEFHLKSHIGGLTGKWIDTGTTALGGRPSGSFHRLTHGHHLFEDGFKVLVNDKLKYGEFLHHLGLDSLTTRGIPNPLIPTTIGNKLIDLGLSKSYVNELLTINIPKILGGSLGLVCAGKDVYMVFSNSIPHTFPAAGIHFLSGSLYLTFGSFPPNILLLTAGVAEIGVSAITAYRTIVDPVMPIVNVPGSVFFPILKKSVALAAVLGACASIFTGSDWNDVAKSSIASAGSAGIATTASLVAAGKGFIAPFLGPLSGIISFIILKKLLDKITEPDDVTVNYIEYENSGLMQTIPNDVTIPLLGTPNKPIGRLENNLLVINDDSIRDQAEVWVKEGNYRN